MSSNEGVTTRRVALDVLARVQDEGAYSNLILSKVLDASALGQQDRGFATDLVYGTLRHQRACDHLLDRFLNSDPPPAARRVLRLGAYQLAYRDDIPDYAAVGTTVEAAPKRFRGLVNAVLRQVARSAVEFPDEATRLSYPDWIFAQLVEDLGHPRAVAALEEMNTPAEATRRSDGYTQDLASQWVVDLVEIQPGELVVDLCAAPGGKATGCATAGAVVVASDLQPHRVELIVENARQLDLPQLLPMVSDALRPAIRAGSADVVLLDAPCSGLGVLRRRPDARWRVDSKAPVRLAALQRKLVDAAVTLLAPGGRLVYSVCTLTAVETLGVDEYVRKAYPHLAALSLPDSPWEPWGRGAILLPQIASTDGMCLFQYR
ncbi:MAG: transcription antitermination factor NusB [Actinomycetes bacterium]